MEDKIMVKKRTVPNLSFDHFLKYDDITSFLSQLHGSSPTLSKIGSIGKSREGRDIPLITITDFTTGDPENKPAYLIHANIHASEVSGTHAALYTARQLIAEKNDLLQRIAFYIVPRLNPDGAEFVLTTRGMIRSRSDESKKLPNTLYQQDIDGNGIILTMRQEHPNGAFIKDPKDPRLMIPRKFDSTGPFYRVFPEGLLHQWDGSDKIEIGGRSFDWNRNWPYNWRPEPDQPGAGDFPFSEQETRHLGEFMHRHSNIFGVLAYHTGAAAVLRAPTSGPDEDIDENDLILMQEFTAIGSRETKFPIVPVLKYRKINRRDVNYTGTFLDFVYQHLGLFCFEFELGTIRNSAGISSEEWFQTIGEEENEALMRRVMQWWDRKKKNVPLFIDWKWFSHPQLKKVEIGGFLNPHLNNPTLQDLKKTSAGTYRFTIAHAKKHPYIVIEEVTTEAIGNSIYKIRAKVANKGALPTNITNKALSLARFKGVKVQFFPAEKSELISLHSHFDIGHIQGISFHTVEWFVKSKGKELGEISVHGETGGNLCYPVSL